MRPTRTVELVALLAVVVLFAVVASRGDVLGWVVP